MKDKNLSGKEILDRYEDKRTYPRVIIDSPISLSLSGSHPIEAMAHDISFEGIQIRCDHNTAQLIKGEDNASDIDVSFTLPLEDGQEAIKARCKIMYILKLIDDTHAMGVRITDIDADRLKDLRRFIEVSMEPI